MPKCEFGLAIITYLGHEIGRGKTAPKTPKLTVCFSFLLLQIRSHYVAFFAWLVIIVDFVFTTIAAALTKLSSPQEIFFLSEKEEKAFHQQTFLSSSPVPQTANFSRTFGLHVDASDIAAGAVLLHQCTCVIYV